MATVEAAAAAKSTAKKKPVAPGKAKAKPKATGSRAEKKASKKEARKSKRKGKLKRLGKALLTGGASEVHRAKKKVKKKIKAKVKEAKSKVKSKVEGAKAKVKSKVEGAKSKAKSKVEGAKTKVKAKVKGKVDKVKSKVNKAAVAVAGATAPGMYGGNKGDYHEHMDKAGHETKSGVVGGGKYGKGGHFKDYEMDKGPNFSMDRPAKKLEYIQHSSAHKYDNGPKERMHYMENAAHDKKGGPSMHAGGGSSLSKHFARNRKK